MNENRGRKATAPDFYRDAETRKALLTTGPQTFDVRSSGNGFDTHARGQE